MTARSPRAGRLAGFALLLGLVLAAGPLLLAARPAHAATTFIVTTTGDESDLLLTDPVCDVSPDDGDQCTLRAAIQEANATPGPDTINFNIPGDGVQTIQPRSNLPTIARTVTIDGYTQPGSSRNTAAVGTNAVLRIELDGSVAGDEGLRIAGANSLVRGLVVNRFGQGIVLDDGATGVRIQGCFVGTDPSGTAALPNSVGIYVDVARGNQIGGSGPAARNLVSGNRADGILLASAADGTRVLGNLIGTTRTGAGNLGNGNDGIDTIADGVIVGGDTAGEANVIAFNDDDGVRVINAIGDRFLRNSIFANGGLGINLDGDGATPNDPLDPDDGANTLQNFPVITSATGSSVQGTLNSTPNQDFVLRLFSNPGTQNEGKFFAAEPLVVTTDGEGNATFTFSPTTPIPLGRSVTATATNNGGSTSEFSAAVPVMAGPPA